MKSLLDSDFNGNQRAAERELDISQSHLSQILKGAAGDRGPGLRVLIRLHEHTKASFDVMLGIARPPPLDERLARLEREVLELKTTRDTPPPKKSTVRPRRR